MYQKINVSFPKAALGSKVTIDTLQGPESLKIPDGVESGEIIKLSGKGMPRLQGRGYGDMYIEVHVKTPKRLNRKAKKIIEQLEQELE